MYIACSARARPSKLPLWNQANALIRLKDCIAPLLVENHIVCTCWRETLPLVAFPRLVTSLYRRRSAIVSCDRHCLDSESDKRQDLLTMFFSHLGRGFCFSSGADAGAVGGCTLVAGRSCACELRSCRIGAGYALAASPKIAPSVVFPPYRSRVAAWTYNSSGDRPIVS